MSDSHASTTGWTGADRWVALALTLVVLGSLGWVVHAWYDPATDAALYVSTARSIAAGEGYAYLGAPFVVRPPGFSFALAPSHKGRDLALTATIGKTDLGYVRAIGGSRGEPGPARGGRRAEASPAVSIPTNVTNGEERRLG